MDPAAAKQQIAERVKQASRFLVTVNANPTVDQLASCIGLTLMLNKMGKHATAVFSGKVPSTIEFLQPEKTLEATADSLRDFIISLDKNKADKLRYKVEDDVVRIFITPYRTSLSEKDFVFSEGDFNVEVVMALGVTQRSQLDQAISAHGRILHDATVVSINTAAGNPSDLGQINWQDPQASSLSEMLVSISEAFGPGLIDSQIATAFLTGIVSETNRFSNPKTSPKVMTMSAQLMAAGANQQLIVSKLEPPPPPPPKLPPPSKPREPEKPKPQPPKLKPEGIINVPRENKKGEKADIDLGTTEIHIDEQGNLRTTENAVESHQDNLPAELASTPELPSPTPPAALPTLPPEPPEPEVVRSGPSPFPEFKPPEESPKSAPAAASPHAFMGNTVQPEWAAPYDLVPMDPMIDEDVSSLTPRSNPTDPDPVMSKENFAQGRTIQPPTEPTPVNSTLDSARSAVQNAYSSAPFDPAFSPPVQSLNTQSVTPPLHDEVPSAPTPASPTDTPSLVLPTDGNGPVGATPPPPPPPEASATAPPPMPPPLMTAPGAVIPNSPPRKQ